MPCAASSARQPNSSSGSSKQRQHPNNCWVCQLVPDASHSCCAPVYSCMLLLGV
jgi:hypothetical protein